MPTALETFLTAKPSPSSTDVAAFLEAFQEPDRTNQAQALIAAGVSATTVGNALSWLNAQGSFSTWLDDNSNTIWGLLSTASAAASGYHGYRRNSSIGWGLAWFVTGLCFPVITPTIAVAQGFGKSRSV